MAEVETPGVSAQRPDSSDNDDDDEEEEGGEFLPGYSTFEEFSKALLSQAIQATKSANALPSEGDDFDYYCSFPGFKVFANRMGSRISKNIGKLIRHQQLPCYWPSGPATGLSDAERDKVLSAEELEEKFESLVEANDLLLERVGGLLDEASGLKKQDKPVLPPTIQHGRAEVASWNKKRDSAREALGSYKFIHAKNVQRPQLKFRDQVDNSNTPFIPLLRTKPNALKPLPTAFQRLQNPTSLTALIANAKEWAGSSDRFEHPYQYELDHFEPMEEQLELREPQEPGSLEEVPLTFIDSLEQLEELQKMLMTVSEFAVDLEAHSYRSYLGFVCLMQVSTRDHDYLIDTLELRHHMNILLDPFTNPRIVKVLHGADWDIPWLQRDFGLYVVNLFDTGQASRVLNLPRYSLAFLLQYCCNVQADKQFQLADWRIRPLPPELVKYAREDTHYLLYIYDRMRNELCRRGNKQNNLLHSVLDRSRDICLKKYEKPMFTEDGYLKVYFKHKRTFNSQQLHCLKLLYAWRDRVAREEDESVGYVLPNHMLFQISEILPRESQGILACCNPIPTLLRQQIQELFHLVQQAREVSLTGPLPLPAVAGSPSPAEGTGASPGPSVRSTSSEVLQRMGVRVPATAVLPVPELPQKISLGSPAHEAKEERGEGLQTARLPDSGPPVQHASASLSAFEEGAHTNTPSKSIVRKLQEIQSSLPDILSQFLEARPMVPSEVILRQQLFDTPGRAVLSTPTTPATASPLTHATPSPSTTPTITQDTPTRPQATERRVRAGEEEEMEECPQEESKERTLSVREMGDQSGDWERRKRQASNGEGEEVVRKRSKVSGPPGAGPAGGSFKPFDYESTQFTNFTKDMPHRDVYTAQEPGVRQRKSGPRSRVHQKFAERSQTYSHGRSGGKRQSWPQNR